MKKFYSYEEYREYYFPVQSDEELLENNPDEWLRRKMRESIDRAFEGLKL